MNTFIRSLAALAALAVSAAAAPSPEKAISKWPPRAKAAASAMIEKYGRPDQFDRNSLAWFNNGAWKRTVVYRAGCPGSRSKTAHLQQTIGYLVPSSRVADLKKFDRRLEVSETAGEMSFCSESEKRNSLALNVADEIVTGKRTAEDGRKFYARTNKLAASGKSSSYSEGLVFEVDNTRVPSPTGGDR